MKNLLFSLVLLVLGVTLNTGHYIYKVEKENAPAYQVESNLKGSVLVTSKFENPLLKDILYRGLLGPYRKEEPPITERSFTNSHGLPFLEDFENENKLQNIELQDSDDGMFKDPKPLTDDAVKTAYKSKSYLFDQMRQRSDVPSEDFLERKKRQVEIPFFPVASQMSMYRSRREPFAPPNTYGMNLGQNGGYVWNNLNNSPSQYELSPPSNGFEDASENPPQTSDTPAFTSAPEPDSGSSEDIYVNINRPTGNEPSEPKEAPEEENQTAKDAFEPRELTESIRSEAGLEGGNDKVTEIPASTVESVSEVKEVETAGVTVVTETPVNEDVVELRTGTESSYVEPEVVGSGDVSGNLEGDEIKEMPEAPTLPPLNYDSLPDYIRKTISTTEKQNELVNPSLKPQPSSDDEEMDGIAAQPEDIQKTYGMNLTSGSGKVWNDLVNPPVSFEVGSTESNQSQESKETTQTRTIIDKTVTAESTETPADENKDNTTPSDFIEVTAPETTTNEPNLVLPGTENNDESKPTELSTTETPEISDFTEPEVKPGTEILTTEAPVTEELTPVTDFQEILSTTETVDENTLTNHDIEPTTTFMPELDEPELGSGEIGDEVSEPEEPGNEKTDIMNELLKSDQFWAWLGEWMAAYTELMEKHIRKIAVQEICNARYSDICPLNKPESGAIIKDGKVIINGKEIELNDLNQLRRGNKGHSVDATTIYGNAVGNDKVTNVFIFNPNNAQDIIEGLKPDNSSNVNIIIEENKEEKGRSDEVTTIPAKPEVENNEITEDAGIEDRKNGDGAEIPKIESTTVKVIESVNAGEIKLEDVKEIEKVTEAVEVKRENGQIEGVQEMTTEAIGLENATEKKLKPF